jgi:DNA-binding XRE family transcriptional regulator
MRKRATVVAADEWLDKVIHRSPAFQAQVEEELAAINVAQDLVALRESRGLSQAQLADRLGITQSAIAQLESAQPKNVELRTLVRVARRPGGRVDSPAPAGPEVASASGGQDEEARGGAFAGMISRWLSLDDPCHPDQCSLPRVDTH